MKKYGKRENGITLIALVITIIILLIIAGVSISMLTGENGILTKATQASEKYKIETAREKIQLAIISYELDKEKTTLYDELRKIEGLAYISPNGENKLEESTYTVIVDGYEFVVQPKEETEALEVIYIGKASEKKEKPEIKVEYDKEKVENLEITITATTKDKEELKQIIVSKKRIEGETIKYDVIDQENVTGKEKIINVTIPANGEYVIQVIGQNDMVAQKEITIDNIVNATIVATIHAGEVIDNHVVITAKAQNTEIPIKSMEIYVDGQKVKTYEYEDIPMEKEETYTITSMEFCKSINCYVKVLNIKGKEATSITITTINKKTVATATDLKNLATQVNSGETFQGKTLQLIADINLNGSNTEQWIPIGNVSNKFKGTLVGNKHQINNLVIKSTGNYQGLFGYVENATITGIVLGNSSNLLGNSYIGGIVGYSKNSTIQNCANYGSIYGIGDSFGGIVGHSNLSTIIGCMNYGIVQDSNEMGGLTRKIGGIVGEIEASTLSYSYNEGNIIGGHAIGGIVGNANTKSKVYNCYNKGNITAWGGNVIDNGIFTREGGIVGVLRDYGEIKYCYNLGNILNNKDEGKSVGGVCGRAMPQDNEGVDKQEYATKIQYCYNSGRITSKGNQVGGVCGANQEYCYITNCYILSNISVIGKMTTATSNIGENGKGNVGKIVGLASNGALPYCGNFGTITTETVYYVVNGLNNGNSQYWSSSNANAPKLLWEN